jgi:hypothetical protein
MKLYVHIERLVLDGLPMDGQSARQVQSAVEAELSRLLVNSIATGAGSVVEAVDVMRTASINLSRSDKPQQVGNAIATALHGGIAKW